MALAHPSNYNIFVPLPMWRSLHGKHSPWSAAKVRWVGGPLQPVLHHSCLAAPFALSYIHSIRLPLVPAIEVFVKQYCQPVTFVEAFKNTPFEGYNEPPLPHPCYPSIRRWV